MEITRERLQTLLHYDPETGFFTWRVSRGKARTGAVAGTKDPRGYIRITIDTRMYPAHRLAWLYMNGVMPDNGVDHKNNDPADNRWQNLRGATQAQNTLNRGASSRSKTGVKNVYPHPDSGFIVRMMTPEGYKHLGCFKSLDEASAFAADARSKHHGDFANRGSI